jgi:nucleotide-binding universal stress UspA family protein
MAAVAHKIMVGFDGSKSSRRALDRAVELAGYASVVTVVVVSGPRENGRGPRLLAEAREHLATRLVPVHALNPVGDPAEELARAAASLRADVLVIGAPSTGSVGSELLERATCDVLVVR